MGVTHERGAPSKLVTRAPEQRQNDMTKHFIRPLHCAQGSTHCSVFDVMSRYSYPGMVLFYRRKLDVDKLEQALARVLTDFPLYAGTLRVTAERLTVEHGTCPAQFEVVHTDRTLDELMNDVRAGRAQTVEPAVSKLKITLTREVTLAVRLTETPDGSVLAVVWNHAIGDMHSTMLLMRAWEAAYSGRPYETPIIVQDRDRYLRDVMPDPVTARSAVQRGSLSQAVSQRLGLMRPAHRLLLEYSWPQLRTLRDSLSQARRVTINDALCAHVFTAVRRLAGATEPTRLCLVVNVRKRLGLSERLLGNMTALLAQPVDEVDPPAQTAAGLREGLEHYATRHANYQATMRVLDTTVSTLDRLRVINRQYGPGTGDMMVTSWANFGVYDLCFGNTQPHLFFPIILGAARQPQWVTVVYELPASRGLGLIMGLPEALAQRCSSPAGRAALYGFEHTEGAPCRTDWARPDPCTTAAAAP
jgi:hypothetical protein